MNLRGIFVGNEPLLSNFPPSNPSIVSSSSSNNNPKGSAFLGQNHIKANETDRP